MKVIVVGTGYVGLVTGVCFASLGHQVLCVDQDIQKVETLRLGHTPIYEPGLEEMLSEQMGSGRLRFSTEVPSLAEFEVALIAVGTPPLPDGAADLSNVLYVARELGEKLIKGAVIATKSTVPVGTAKRIDELLHDMGREDLRVASVPEFLREGSAMDDTLHPHRIILGVQDLHTARILEELHTDLHAPVVVCDPATAEMIKYASNAFLATKISFINEIANICARVGADVNQVAHGMGLDPRIGASFLRAGLGYGGSCFPKDTRALVNIAGDVDYDFQLLKAVVSVNQRQRMEPIQQLREWFGDLSGKHIALLGMAFKPGTDDVRESPSVELANVLQREGVHVQLYDPVVRYVRTVDGEVRVSDNIHHTLKGMDAAILVTEWPELLAIDWGLAKSLMKQPFFFDGRNVLEPDVLQTAGFTFANVGRRDMFLFMT